MTEVLCKDCIAEGVTRFRPVAPPGPRCATHARRERKRQREQSHRRRVKSQYGLAEGQYEILYQWQDGKCFICRRATGASRRLSVDHDHKSGLVRGLLCRPCNSLLGHGRDDPEFFRRVIKYLAFPPAFEAIGEVRPTDGDQV